MIEIIENSYKKFNFIDYKLVEEALEANQFSEELESLKLEQQQSEEQIIMFEKQEEAIPEQQQEDSPLENESVFEGVDDTGNEEALFGGNPFEVIKGDGIETVAEGLSDTAEGLAQGTEVAGEVLEAVGEGVEAVVDGMSDAA